MMFCEKCGKTSIIQVATSDGVSFYSCITEGCEYEARLLVYLGDDNFLEYIDVYKALNKIVEDEENNDKEGES